ncbi:hypothetical protein [Leptospira sp. 'Mane']|uniref:hypothetical protein n=1 Tax=Leptospira sp. 'Mane' TaxID=3387407 RepID=UPI00398B2689
MRFQNNTESIQQINRITEDSRTIFPGDIVEIDKSEVYDFELARVRNIFTELTERNSEKEIPKKGKPTVRTETSDSKNEVAR